MEKINFIVTTVRGRELEACREVKDILSSLGDESPKVEATEISGLLVGHTNLDILGISEMLKKLTNSEPWKIHLLQRFIPLQLVIRSSLDGIAQAAKKLSKQVEKDETFKVVVEKRHTNLESADVIKAVASIFDQKVDLEKPDKVVLVEVAGPLAGVSIIKPDQVFSSVVAKRGI